MPKVTFEFEETGGGNRNMRMIPDVDFPEDWHLPYNVIAHLAEWFLVAPSESEGLEPNKRYQMDLERPVEEFATLLAELGVIVNDNAPPQSSIIDGVLYIHVEKLAEVET